MDESSRVLEWSLKAFPYAGPSIEERPIDGLSTEQIAALNLALAYQDALNRQSADTVAYRLGLGLNGFGRTLVEEGRSADAGQTFSAAYACLTSVFDRQNQPDHFKRAIGFAYKFLKDLGIEDSALGDPPPMPLMVLDDILEGLPAVDTPESGADSVVAHADVASNLPSAPGPRNMADMLAKLRSSWTSDRASIGALAPPLLAYVEGLLGKSGILQRDLGSIFRDDIAELDALVGGDGLGCDRKSLEVLTRDFRRFAFDAAANERERRRRWLLSAVANNHLWTAPGGVTTNEPQVLIDLMGYVGAVLMDHRYDDMARDLLLDCAETQVRLACDVPPVVLSRFKYLRDWLLTATGTYLLLAGPDPSTPSDSYYDPRIQSDLAAPGRGLQRAERSAWPEILLAKWQSGTALDGACYSVASLSGWDAERSSWLVDRIYDQSNDERRDSSRAYWQDKLSGLMSRVDRVRVATNPWGVEQPAASRGTMITSGPTGALVIPDGVLRAAVAQGLGSDDVVAIHGHLFSGRRVPTYLLTNRYGPFAIFKIDHREKVRREVRNFAAFAKRLHQSNRPSECTAFPMDMYLGEDGAPLRAIQTSYVFQEDDSPLTLGAWLRSAQPADAAAVIERLLISALRPWLAHVKRDRVDLRLEYPIVRPAPAPSKQSPSSWVEKELAKIETSDVVLGDGTTISRTQKECPWFDELDSAPSARTAVRDLALINPVWFAAELGEVGSGEFLHVVDCLEVGLRDFDTLLSLCHGDLHLDNVLCAVAGGGRPRTVLIDFESAHTGHVCKDIARLEASVLCQVFQFDEPSQLEGLVTWFADSLGAASPNKEVPALFTPPTLGSGDTALATTTHVVAVLREIAFDCGQRRWPIREDEYLLALLAALLPMVRYSTLTDRQRRLALLLSTVLASHLYAMWTEMCDRA